MHMSLSLFYMIFNCHVCYFVIIVYFQFAVVILANISFVCLSPFQILHVTISTMSPVRIYPNRASYNTLMKLSDYFMVDHVAHSKFDASHTPKEKIALRQVKGMRWPRLVTSFTHQWTRCGMLVELAWDCPSPLNI